MAKDSFLIHTEYIEDLPEENKADFLLYIYDYGSKGIEPALEGFAKTIWTKIKRRMDSDEESYEKRLNNLRKNKTSPGAESTSNRHRIEPESTPNRDRVDGVSVYVYDSVSDSVSEFESESVSDGAFAPPLSPAQEDFSKQAFEIFKDAGLPCCEGNYLSFLQRDFKLGLPYLRGYSTREALEACQNYASIFQKSTTDAFWRKQKVAFDKFCERKIRDFLPGNFVPEKYEKATREDRRGL